MSVLSLNMKKKIGIINLGLIPEGEYFAKFKYELRNVIDKDYWDNDFEVFDYKNIDPVEIKKSIDTLVISPASEGVKIGLPSHVMEHDPALNDVYKFIRDQSDNIPMIGINGGHQVVNCAYNNAIIKIPEEIIEEYQRKQPLEVHDVLDMLDGVDNITITLGNNYLVLPKEKQTKREGQDKIIPLVKFMGGILIAKVDSKAPVYGVQFNIQPRTEPVFRNFFNLAKNYLEKGK